MIFLKRVEALADRPEMIFFPFTLDGQKRCAFVTLLLKRVLAYCTAVLWFKNEDYFIISSDGL